MVKMIKCKLCKEEATEEFNKKPYCWLHYLAVLSKDELDKYLNKEIIEN